MYVYPILKSEAKEDKQLESTPDPFLIELPLKMEVFFLHSSVDPWISSLRPEGDAWEEEIISIVSN